MNTLPGNTKIDNLGLSADEIQILTPTDRALTKDDLLKLRDISRANPAAPDDTIRGEFNTFLQSEGKQQLTVVDFEITQDGHGEPEDSPARRLRSRLLLYALLFLLLRQLTGHAGHPWVLTSESTAGHPPGRPSGGPAVLRSGLCVQLRCRAPTPVRSCGPGLATHDPAEGSRAAAGCREWVRAGG